MLSIEENEVQLRVLLEVVNEGRPFTDQERDFVFSQLNSPHPKLRHLASVLAPEMGKPMIMQLINKFDTLTQEIQRFIYLFLATTQYQEAYSFLIDRLKTEKNNHFREAITLGLSKTDYPILPILLNRLYTDDLSYSVRLQHVLKEMGFGKIEYLLALMPQIPHERLFRTLFGNKKINDLKYKGRQFPKIA